MPLVNECQFRAVSGGLGDFVVASAITGFFTPEQCTNPVIVDGVLYHWRAESDDFSQHELVEGTYNSATDTVARTTILQSSNGGAKVNFSAAPRVRQVAIKQDFDDFDTGGRIILTANTDFYVRTDGNNANDGLSNNAGGAWRNIGYGAEFISNNIDCGVFTPTLNVAAGTYAENPVVLGNITGVPEGTHVGNHVNILGDPTTPTNVVIECTNNSVGSFGVFHARGTSAAWYVDGFHVKFVSGAQYTSLLFCNQRAQLVVGNMRLGEVGNGGALFDAEGGGGISIFPVITLGATMDVDATSIIAFFYAFGTASVSCDSFTVTFRLQNNVTVGQSSASAGVLSVLGLPLVAFDLNGFTVTGTRFDSYLGSIILNGGGANFFPGSVAGFVTTGGQYF